MQASTKERPISTLRAEPITFAVNTPVLLGQKPRTFRNIIDIAVLSL